MNAVTADLGNLNYKYETHYNMGQLGYGYGYRSVEQPRLSFILRFYRPSHNYPDGALVREFFVDGGLVAIVQSDEFCDQRAFQVIAAALDVPPVLSDDERRVLAMVPTEFTNLRELEDELAGVPHPEGAIFADTPHYRVMQWLRSLKSKGMVEYGKQPTSGVMGFEPTIRRRENV